MSSEQTQAEMEKQNSKFSYKAPESVYKKHQAGMTAKGQAFSGVSPMDFYARQNAAKKAERAKEAETKQGLYKNNLFKSTF